MYRDQRAAQFGSRALPQSVGFRQYLRHCQTELRPGPQPRVFGASPDYLEVVRVDGEPRVLSGQGLDKAGCESQDPLGMPPGCGPLGRGLGRQHQLRLLHHQTDAAVGPLRHIRRQTEQAEMQPA